jgi:predicted metal-dependent peptidase
MLNHKHEKIELSIEMMLVDTVINLPYYGEFNLSINFFEQETIETCGVNVTSHGMNFYYSPKFLNDLSQKEINFIILHEDFHLLFNHPKRTITGLYDHKLANVAQDMIINHIIWEDISHTFIEIPKDKNGKNMGLFVPIEYNGKLIFEELYEWLRDEKEKRDKNKSTDDDNDDSEKGKYGPYGKNPGKEGETIDTWSIDQIFQDLDNNEGEYLDKHITDNIPQELRESMIKDIMERLSARGLSSGNIEQTLEKLRKKRKDYLKEIKRAVSNIVFGTVKQATITKPNRRQIPGLKGNRKIKTKINVILDTSGSMSGGLIEKVMNYIYKNDVEVNLIQADAEVKKIDVIKNTKNLNKINLVGFGGTSQQPAIDYVIENCNQYNTLMLGDGYCENLDISGLKGKVLIISVGCKYPIFKGEEKAKQILVDLEYH